MTPREFANKILTNCPIALPASEAGSEERAAVREAMIDEATRQERGARGQIFMPAWEVDPQIHPHILNLLAYLSARADGILGPGKPTLAVEKKP